MCTAAAIWSSPADGGKSLAHWGNTVVSGRGLVALAGRGLVHQVTLQPGEEYTVHPAHVMAYSITSSAPQPYRFKSGRWTLQPPNPLTWLPDAKFWHTMRQTATWRHASRLAFTLRTWARRTIWGDRVRFPPFPVNRAKTNSHLPALPALPRPRNTARAVARRSSRRHSLHPRRERARRQPRRLRLTCAGVSADTPRVLCRRRAAVDAVGAQVELRECRSRGKCQVRGAKVVRCHLASNRPLLRFPPFQLNPFFSLPVLSRFPTYHMHFIAATSPTGSFDTRPLT